MAAALQRELGIRQGGRVAIAMRNNPEWIIAYTAIILIGAMVLYVEPGEALTADELRAYLQSRLAAYKVPRYIRFAELPLPQNASGKLHKLKVSEAFLESMQ